VRKVNTNITEVNHGAGETGSASSQMLASATSLGNSNRLKLEVDKFLKAVRSVMVALAVLGRRSPKAR